MLVIDPRVKLILVALLTGIIIFNNNLIIQSLITILMVILALLLKANIFVNAKKFKRVIILFFSLALIQSFFRQSGEVYLKIGEIPIITEGGLILAINYAFRILVIFLSGVIISTSNMRNILQGLVQLKLPYELGLMTSIGIRFMPILMEEIVNAYTAMELRGINLKKLPLKKRPELIGRLFVPIVYRALMRAKKISESIEMRGFIIREKRSSYYTLKFTKIDFLLIISVLAISITIIIVFR